MPAPFRAILQTRGLTSVALHPALLEPCLEGAGIDRFDNLLANQADAFVPQDRDEAAELIMEELRELPLDGEGRVVLPDEFIANAKLTDQAAFVGRGWKFQIWEPSLLASAKAGKRERVARLHTPGSR